MANILMYIKMIIQLITPSVEYNYWLKRLNTQNKERTSQNSVNVPKVVKPTNKKTFFLNFGD